MLAHKHGMSCFAEDGRSGTFVIGDERFPASLLDLPCVVESYKTYDDCALVKTSDIGQVIMLVNLSVYIVDKRWVNHSYLLQY